MRQIGQSEYNDEANIDADYIEAVGVMDLIDVINGDEHGFRPGDPISRAEAAAIIHRLFATRPNADAFTAYTSAFTDVATTAWYASPIAWCYQQGIVAGNGDGTFDPEGKVTGFQFAKMLLTGMGYNAVTEGYVNTPDWAANINTDALTAGYVYEGYNYAPSGLLESLRGIDLDAPLTREQAAQMGYNALFCAKVKYEGGVNITTPDGLTMTSGGTLEQVMDLWTFVYAYNLDVLTGDRLPDDAPVNLLRIWEYNNEQYEVYDTPVLTYTAAEEQKAVTADLKGYDYADTVTIVTDGVAETASWAGGEEAAGIKALTGNGVKVDVYIHDYDYATDEIYAVYVTNTGLVKVGDTNATTGAISVTPVTGIWTTDPKIFNGTVAKSETDPIYNTLAAVGKGGYALVTTTGVANADTCKTTYTIATAQPVSPMTGVITYVSSEKDSIAVYGSPYDVAKNATGVSGLTAIADKDKEVFRDAYGYVICVQDPTEDSEPTAVVPNLIYTTTDEFEVVGTWGNTYRIQGVTATGETVIWDIEYVAVDGEKGYVATKNPATEYEVQQNTVYKYVDQNKNGIYELLDATKADIESNDDKTGYGTAPTADTDVTGKVNLTVKAKDDAEKVIYFASDVKFIYVTGEKDGIKVHVDTGVQKQTIKDSSNVVIGTDAAGNPLIVAVYIATAYTPPAGDGTSGVIYIAEDWDSATPETKVENGKTLYGYKGYVDGVETTVWLAAEVEAETVGFKALTTVDGVSEVGADVSSLPVVSETVIAAISPANGKYYLTTDGEHGTGGDLDITSAKIYDVRSGVDSADKVKNITGLLALMESAESGEVVTIGYTYTAETKTVTAIYIRDFAAPAGDGS